MQFTATQIADLINGKIEGDPDIAVSSFGKIEEATEGQLAFLANPKYEEFLYSTKASVIIINTTLQVEKEIGATLSVFRMLTPHLQLLLTEYAKMVRANLTGIQQPVYISATASMGENIFIGAFAYLGENVIIGNNVKLYPTGLYRR